MSVGVVSVGDLAKGIAAIMGAANTWLAIIALMIVGLTILALVLFRRTAAWIRTTIFLVLVLGVALFISTVYRTSLSPRPTPLPDVRMEEHPKSSPTTATNQGELAQNDVMQRNANFQELLNQAMATHTPTPKSQTALDREQDSRNQIKRLYWKQRELQEYDAPSNSPLSLTIE
jgi:hypothetical protein